MKILAINGSHRGRTGFTQVLIDKLFVGAKRAGASCETVILAEKKIERCLACWACQRKGSPLQCVYHGIDDVETIFVKMREADLIVFATPIYIFNMSGLLKTFIDRFCSAGLVKDLHLTKSGLLFHHADPTLFAKPIAVILTCDSFEEETYRNVVSYFKTYAKFLDLPLRGVLTRRQGTLVGYGHDRHKEAVFPKIYDIYQAYEEAGKELAGGKAISRSTQRRANRNLLPIPAVDLLKRIRPFKVKLFEHAKREMRT